MKCPENTCLVTNTKELVKCVDYNSNIKIYNGICIEEINELVYNKVNFVNDDDIETIITSSGVAITVYSSDASIDNLIQKYSNLTYVNLGECKNKLIETYNLPSETKLYILGIDSPNLYGNSSINNFTLKVYIISNPKI